MAKITQIATTASTEVVNLEGKADKVCIVHWNVMCKGDEKVIYIKSYL